MGLQTSNNINRYFMKHSSIIEAIVIIFNPYDNQKNPINHSVRVLINHLYRVNICE